MLEEIKNHLQTDHYYHLKQAISEDQFNEYVEGLGDVLRREDVRLYLSQRGVHQPRPLGFHTDQPYVNVIAWQCVKADPQGPTLLFDLGKFVESLDESEIEALRKVVFFYPDPDVRTQLTPEPLIKDIDGHRQIFYMSWHVSRNLEPPVNGAWRRFFDRVEEAAHKHAIPITLKEGECFFIDNKAVLHARPAISQESPRHLKRVWLRSEYGRGISLN